MGFLANLLVKIGVDNSDLNAGMDKATRSVNKFGTDVESAGKRLTLGFSLPMAGLGLAAIKTAGEMEQTKVAFTTLMKSADAAGAHLAQLKSFALVTPFQFDELTKASRLMQAYGFNANEVVPKLRTIGNAVSALGGGSDLLERIVRSMGEIGTKGKIGGEQLRELSRAGIPALDAVAKKMGVSVAEAQRQISAGTVDAKTAMDGLLEYMDTRFKGGMEAQSKTVLGSWSNVKDKIAFTLADIGTALLPIAKNAMAALDPVLDKVKALTGEFSKLPGPIQNAALGTAGFAAVLPLLAVGLGAVITNSIVIAGALGKLGSVTLALATSLGGQLSAALGVATAGAGALGLAVAAATGTLVVLAGLGIAKVVEAALALRDAQAQLNTAQGQSAHLIQELEIRLTRHGANLDDLKKQYASGLISLDAYRTSLLALAKQYASTTEAGKAHGEAVMSQEKAFEILGIKSTAERKKTLEDTKAAYSAVAGSHKENSRVMWEASNKVTEAQEALNLVLVETKERLGAAFKFGEKGIESAVLVEQLKELHAQSEKYVQDVVKAGGETKYLAGESLKLANALELLQHADDQLETSRSKKFIDDLLYPLPKLTDELQLSADALEAFGLAGKRTDIELLERRLRDLGTGVNNNTVSVEQYTRAWLELAKAKDAAGVKLDPETISQVIELEKQYGGQIRETRKEHSKFQQEADRLFHSITRGIASSIVNWKGWGETFKTIAKDTAQGILTIMVEGLFKKLAKELADLLANTKGVIGTIGKWLGGLAGGGGSAATSTIASAGSTAASVGGSAASSGASVAGAAGSAVGAGISGVVSAVSGVVSAVSSVIGNFQMAGMNKSLDVLVNHTLRIFNIANQSLGEQYAFKGQLFLKLDDIWNEVRNVVSAVKSGGGSGKGGLTFNNCSFNGTAQQNAAAIFDYASLAGVI